MNSALPLYALSCLIKGSRTLWKAAASEQGLRIAEAGAATRGGVFRALGAGATGFFVVDSACLGLPDAIRELQDRGIYLCPLATGYLLQLASEVLAKGHRGEGFTARDKDILEPLARGLVVKEAADKAGVTPGTVRAHLDRICGRLGLPTREAVIVVYAFAQLLD